MQVVLAPSPESPQAARAAVSDFLARLGRADLIDDATLIVDELAANAMMHARTEMVLTIELAGAGVRIMVADGSHILPRWTPPSPTATAGRGLLLVERLSRRWGFAPLPGGGKSVWAELEAPSSSHDHSSAEDLLELWADEPWPALPVADADDSVGSEIDVEIDVDVKAMLDSRAHTDEIVRDLQLTLLNAADPDTRTGARPIVLRLARQLDAANEEFQEARRQIYNQAVSAAHKRQTRVRLTLRLRQRDAQLARRWLEVLDEADALTANGTLLLPPFPPELTAFRRSYITEIVEQLEAVS